MKKIFSLIFLLFMFATVDIPDTLSAGDDSGNPQVCRPELMPVPKIELGKAGLFNWTCSGAGKPGVGYYIVFIRPSGTYVLLKVSQDRSFFEFTPDVAGSWRWIVINTDPDRAKPDVESEPGRFQVVPADEPAH